MTTATKVTASGSRWINRLHYSMYSSSKVEAITILETEKSYVNILLGNYDVPEVSVDLVLFHFNYKIPQTFQDFLRKFSRYNFAQYCLGLLFTNRLFKVFRHSQN